MSNLGSMVLELSANYARFQSDLGKAAHIAQEQAEKMKRTLESVGAALGVGLGADAFKEWINGAIEAQDQALKLSQKIGVSTEAIAGLSSAAKKADVDQQSLQVSMVKLSKSAAEAAAGVAQPVAMYKALGVSVTDASGKLKTSDVILGDLADKFAGYKDGVEKTALAVAIFGKSGADMIPLLNQGSEAIQKQTKLVEDLGAAITAEGAHGAEEFKDKLKDLGLVSAGVANQIAQGLLPALNKLADKALAFFTSDTWKSWLASIRSAAETVANNFDRIGATIKLMGELAVDYIGVRLVGSIIKASAEMATLVIKTLAANSAAAEMGLSFQTGVLASIKQIGILNAALGSVVAVVSGWQIGTYLYEQFSTVQKVANNFFVLFDAGWTAIKSGAQIAALYIEKAFFEMLDAVAGRLSDSLASWGGKLANLPNALGGSKLQAQFLGLSAAIAPSGKSVADLDEQIKKLSGEAKTSLKIITTSWNEDSTAAAAAAAATEKHGDAAKKTAPNVAGLADANKKAAEEAAKLAEMFQKDAEQLAAIQARIDPVQGSYQNYVKTIEQAVDAYDKEIALAQTSKNKDDDLAQALANLNAKRAAAVSVQQESIAALIKENDIVGKYFQTLKDQSSLIGLDDRTKAITEAVNRLTQGWKDGNPAVMAYLVSIGKIDPTSEEGRAAIERMTGSLYDQQKAADLATEAARGWQQIWITAGNGVADTFAKILVNGGSLFKGLKDLAKQAVEQIIAYFAKLAVINPILNGIFGGQAGYSILPQLGSSVANSFGGTLLGGAGAAGGGSAVGAGLQAAGGSAGGVFDFLGKTVGSTGIELGTILSGAGALFAGYSRFKSGGGPLGAAAYGYGTYVAAGVGTAVAGGVATAGVSGGLAAGSAALGAIPVVGWIALAALLIDKFSGGKLFGTSANKFQSGTQTETIGANGASVLTEAVFKGQKAFFGGSYYKTKTEATSPEAIKAANDFYTALKSGTDAFAKSFGLAAGTVVGGSFSTTFDKNGKATGTSSTVLGVTRKGETDQQFAERLQADSYLAVLDKMGLGASAFVAGMQDDADKLFAAVQDFATVATAANTDLANGFKFLALSTNATLVDVVKFAEAQQQAGETLTQTYARLEQAQAQYNQFVQQFTPGTVYVDDFEAAMSNAYHTMLQNIDAANKLAIAAGASGAAQQDLTNIQAAAASQMAALTVQLENSAQSLAFSLGLTTMGSLDQVTGAIGDILNAAKKAPDTTAAMDSAAASTSNALIVVGNFGSTMGAVAKQATDAINLLLGNLSILNDQQKLQVALNGLRDGTVSKDQVLQIGQALYASSEAYVKLFNQVMAMPDRSASDGSGGGGGGRSAHSHSASSTSSTVGADYTQPKDWTDTADQWKGTGLTLSQWNAMSSKDQLKLEDLLNKQATLQASKSMQDFQTLGQQIAEIAAAKGEDFQTVIDEMGINNKDLEKGLGLKTDAELNAYLSNVQKQLDSAKENTTTIVDAINLLPQHIAEALGGSSKTTPRGIPLTQAPGPAPAPSPPSDPVSGRGPVAGDGRGSRTASLPGGRMLSDADVRAVGAEIGRQIAPALNQQPRSNRQVATR